MSNTVAHLAYNTALVPAGSITAVVNSGSTAGLRIAYLGFPDIALLTSVVAASVAVVPVVVGCTVVAAYFVVAF